MIKYFSSFHLHHLCKLLSNNNKSCTNKLNIAFCKHYMWVMLWSKLDICVTICVLLFTLSVVINCRAGVVALSAILFENAETRLTALTVYVVKCLVHAYTVLLSLDLKAVDLAYHSQRGNSNAMMGFSRNKTERKNLATALERGGGITTLSVTRSCYGKIISIGCAPIALMWWHEAVDDQFLRGLSDQKGWDLVTTLFNRSKSLYVWSTFGQKSHSFFLYAFQPLTKGSMTGCLLLEELIWTGEKKNRFNQPCGYKQ